MSPEITETDEAGAAPTAEAPSWASDALDALIGDDYSDVEGDETEGAPAADAAHSDPEGEGTDQTETGDDPTETETSDDEPEELKDTLKGLTRAAKGKVLSHYRGLAEKTLKEAQEIADRTKADNDAREAKAQEIRQSRGKYIGEVESQREDGTPVPTYKELERLLTTRGGDDILDDKFGLSRDEALDLKGSWDERKAMLDGSLDDFRTEAWVEGGKKLAASVATAGLPIEQVWKGVKGIEDVVPNVVRHLEHESRLRAATANGPAVAARTAAKTLPQPETGGRGDASGARIYTESELSDPAFFKAHEADIDRAMEEGRIRPG
jgi:hypothetical protein